MKRFYLFMFIFLFFRAEYYPKSVEVPLTDFIRARIVRDTYRNKDNWEEITKNNNQLYLFYKTDIHDGHKYISELYYVLENIRSERYILGGFSKNKGFFNHNLKPFTIRGGVDIKTEFMQKYLLGLSMATIKSPFIIRGIALDDDGEVYETEVMEMFSIDSNKMTIEEWFPNL